ncbi:MAG: LuxR C-terminal-related transcriptional regulator [Myxococcota bacterium]
MTGRTTTHPEPTDAPPEGAAPVLHGVRGACAGVTFELTTRQCTVGKADDADIRIRETGVSRRHAKVVVAADKSVTVMDLASTNGTFINGTRIDVASVGAGDSIRFGPTACVRLAYRGPKLSAATPADAPLSARQLEVAQLVARGLTNDEVAVELGLSPKTIKSHLDQIYRRLDISSRAALTRWLADAGLLQP